MNRIHQSARPMITKQKITGHIQPPNDELEVLKKHYPQFFDKNGNFDFEKFKNHLAAKEVNFSKETYTLDWLGKSYARLLATDETDTLLQADDAWNRKPENRNSGNLLLKGDNLDVLKHLSHAYYEKIKMIYIDPPYNTGNDGFVYHDNRKFTPEQLAELAGIDEEKARRILAFTQSKSNSHSAWLTFMYPRLYIARKLLRPDGVIFISIDDNELAQLRIMMDEIFGEENFVATIIVKSNPGGRDYGGIALTHDYVLVYTKEGKELNLIENKEKKFQFTDEIGPFDIRELRNRNIKFNKENRPNLFYPFYVNPNNVDKNGLYEISLGKKEGYIEVYPLISQGIQTVWRWGKDRALQNLNTNLKAKKKLDGTFMIVEKYRGNKYRERSIFEEKIHRNEQGSLREKYVFDGQKPFDYPKSDILIKKLILLGANPSDLILDFFAGSGTTGDAVMQLNAEDGGQRQFILVQLPEPIDPKKNKTAYDFVKNELGKENPTVFDITRERLVRAARKIKTDIIQAKIREKQAEIQKLESQLDMDNRAEKIRKLQAEIQALEKQDSGFKIFETIPVWEDYHWQAEDFTGELELFDESKLTEQDIRALLITWKTYDGMPLTRDLEAINLNGYTAYYGDEKLYLMHKGFDTEHLKALLEKMDTDKDFNPKNIIAFGYHFTSKALREIAENIKSYANKKELDMEFILRF